ncbi:hypothetical protein CCAX7_57220 [Capsulimonas corticalis]|uniref:Uncharacterized protein n=1 Tax=Capsulimonas corticalis TaxID=2219043 RepID=A0A402D0G5_9BACT|nr:hypothetical protein [Capsulimonas corticalis]BDI33671.1 hypothetical protein CCAX7_57220 [Capsulimonas corticalis]
MLNKLKALFQRSKAAEDLPDGFWVLLNMANNTADIKPLSPEQMIDTLDGYARQAQAADTLMIVDSESGPEIWLFSSQESAQEFVQQIMRQTIAENPEATMGAFTMVSMQRAVLFPKLARVPSLHAILDPATPAERVIPAAEIRASVGLTGEAGWM